jgi:hypothetical protein
MTTADKLTRSRRRRLARESAKLLIEEEQAFAEEGMQPSSGSVLGQEALPQRM